ncbi:MAG: hypothetical protein LBR05_11070 [Azoarcus sp.]|jgi:hypothetical protein|nr:hypothetical protein [Azoarcus sp.]
MMPPDKICSYQALAQAIAELRALTAEGRWEEAARVMSSLAERARELPAADVSDRDAIEGALSILARLTEQVRPLHDDPKQLLLVMEAETD